MPLTKTIQCRGPVWSHSEGTELARNVERGRFRGKGLRRRVRLTNVLDYARTGPEQAREIINWYSIPTGQGLRKRVRLLTVLDSDRTGPEKAREIINCTRFRQDRA